MELNKDFVEFINLFVLCRPIRQIARLRLISIRSSIDGRHRIRSAFPYFWQAIPEDMGTSLNGVIVFKSYYGSTKQYAEWTRKELRIPMIEPERLDDGVLAICDFVVIGTPVYRGKMLIRDWLGENRWRLRGKRLFLFVVCTHFADRERQLMMIRDNIPEGMLASCEAWFLPGKVMIGELTEADRLFLNLENLTEDERVEKDAATQASDPVREGNITQLLERVRAFAAAR